MQYLRHQQQSEEGQMPPGQVGQAQDHPAQHQVEKQADAEHRLGGVQLDLPGNPVEDQARQHQQDIGCDTDQQQMTPECQLVVRQTRHERKRELFPRHHGSAADQKQIAQQAGHQPVIQDDEQHDCPDANEQRAEPEQEHVSGKQVPGRVAGWVLDQVQQQLQEFEARQRIEPRRGLVEHQQFRFEAH